MVTLFCVSKKKIKKLIVQFLFQKTANFIFINHICNKVVYHNIFRLREFYFIWVIIHFFQLIELKILLSLYDNL